MTDVLVFSHSIENNYKVSFFLPQQITSNQNLFGHHTLVYYILMHVYYYIYIEQIYNCLFFCFEVEVHLCRTSNLIT